MPRLERCPLGRRALSHLVLPIEDWEDRVEITCGVDWAEDHHDVAVMDDHGRVLARGRIGVDIAGYSELIALIVEHGGSAADTPVAIETDKNLLVLALRASGFTVYPINPRAVARYRERHHQAGQEVRRW